MPSGFAVGKGGGGVGERRNCLGRDEVSLKLPDCGSEDVTTPGACTPESSLRLFPACSAAGPGMPWDPHCEPAHAAGPNFNPRDLQQHKDKSPGVKQHWDSGRGGTR